MQFREYIKKSTNYLIKYEGNSRVHSEEQISQIIRSINEFGFTNPILIDENNMIIAGHCRLEAALKLGLKELPCIVIRDFSDSQKSAYIIADNKLALNSGWDEKLLKSQFEFLKQKEFDLTLTGFDLEEIFDLLPDEDIFSVEEEIIPELPKDPISKYGDIWILGNHRLMCGNSCLIDDVNKLMQGNTVDLFLSDPPYNVNYEGKTKDCLKIKNDSMTNEKFRQFLIDAFKCADVAMKKGAVFYIWHADIEGYNFRGACQDVGWKIRQCLIWVKNNLVMGRQDYHWKHEPCLY